MKINYPNMVLRKSEGATNSERYLIEKCENTFLSLWSYPNPFTTEKKGKELCDVLAVFQNHIFIFSDKFCVWKGDIDKRIAWNRWYRHAVEAGAKQILGAERYIKSNGEIFLDAKLTQRFPLPIEITPTTRIHRIIVARGAKDACVDYFNGGTGSLVVDTRIEGIHHLYEVDRDGAPVDTDAKPIFTIGLVMGRQNYFHVFDDYTLDHIMDELDTVSDFIDYLEQKEKLIEAGKDIIAEGEEEILGRHLSTIENEQHCCVTISEFQNHQCFYFADFWQNYLHNPNRYVKQKANAQSYIWDALLEKAFRGLMNGTLREMSHQDYVSQAALFFRFAKPNRVERRALAKAFVDSYNEALNRIDTKSPTIHSFVRRICFETSKDTMITILWLHYPQDTPLDSFLTARKRLLEAKILEIVDSHKQYEYHIGIAKTLEIDRDDSDDFVYIRSDDFSSDCPEILDAKKLLMNGPTLIHRDSSSVHIEEYRAGSKTAKIPYPWE